MSGYEDILGANARIWFYLRRNSGKGRRIADSKLKTKKVLGKNKVCVPKVLGLLKTQQEVRDFQWEQLEGNFVIKPASGSGGRGVLVVKKRAKWAGEWFLMDGKKVNVSDLRLHCSDILEGRFSLYGKADQVLVEERIKIHPKFLRFTNSGTPDVRIIVFNYVPVMAMLRLPQEESEGKANLHQGAIGLGIDLATGITTYGVKYNNPVRKIYDYRRKKKVKVNGIKIPDWKKVLKTAVRCQKAVPSLDFLGVDVVLDKEKGPMVLELNARPGLSIQICNRAGLKRRLKRVEGVSVRSIKHGVKISRALFGEEFASKVNLEEKSGKKVVKVIEPIKLVGANSHGKVELLAKADTGAYRSSIDEDLAKKLGLLDEDNILYHRNYKSSIGEGDRRPVIPIEFWVKGKKISCEANVTDRSNLKTKFLIGRQDLKGFLVEVE
jgi:alpha-L-glutamate ligase-like protein